MVGSEAVPFAKTGGLADVVGALPGALVRLGHQVDLVMPRYRGISSGRPERTLTVALAPPHISTSAGHVILGRGPCFRRVRVASAGFVAI